MIFARDDLRWNLRKHSRLTLSRFLSRRLETIEKENVKRWNPIGRGESIARYNVLDHPRSPAFITARTDLFRFQLSPPDRRNSTINFASRKRERFSFHFDRPRSRPPTCRFHPPLRSLSLSSGKIYSLLSPKGKNLFLRSIGCRVSILFIALLYFQPFKEKKDDRVSMFRADFSDFFFIPFPLDYLSSVLENGWREVTIIRHRYNLAQGTSKVEKVPVLNRARCKSTFNVEPV